MENAPWWRISKRGSKKGTVEVYVVLGVVFSAGVPVFTLAAKVGFAGGCARLRMQAEIQRGREEFMELTDTDITKAIDYIDRHNCITTPNAQGTGSRLRAHALLGRTMTPGDQGRHPAEEGMECIPPKITGISADWMIIDEAEQILKPPRSRKKVARVDATG